MGEVGNGAKGVKAEGSVEDPVEVIVCKYRYPGSAEHIEKAKKDGHPNILTIEKNVKGGTKHADINRKQSLKGVATKKKYDRDEYPPAMFKEGGYNASVKHVLASDNRGAGSSIGSQLEGYENGTKVVITTGKCPKCDPQCEDINAGKEEANKPILDIPPKST